MYKVLLHETYTKRDVYGNTYHTVRITNPKTMKSFTTETPSLSNVRQVLTYAFNRCYYYETSACTGSTRLSSLPDHIYLDCCNLTEDWKKELRKIDYRIKRGEK